MPYSVRLTIFIVVTVLTAVAFFLLFFYEPIRKAIYRLSPSRLFYGKVRSVVLNHDFYLLNELSIGEGDYDIKIDHLIGGDKYIYLIFDLFFEGGIALEPDDARWVTYSKKGKRYIDNPLIAAEGILGKLSAKTGIDPSLMVAIVLVNEDCFLTPYRNKGTSPLLVPLNRFQETIENLESRDVPHLQKEQLWQTIHDLYEFYKKHKEER